MKNETIIIAGAIAAVAALAYAKRAGAAPGIVAGDTALSGDAARMQGIADLYGTSAAQSMQSDAAVKQNWQDLGAVFASQPDFYP